MDADFNGYIQVSTKSGLVSCIISEDIPVSLKKGVVSEIVVPCSCKANTALKQYRLNVNCYDSSKNKLGILSHNTKPIQAMDIFGLPMQQLLMMSARVNLLLL